MEPACNHQMNRKPKFLFESEHNPLAKAAQLQHTLSGKCFDWRFSRAQQERTYELQPF
jgi:hypothetical protein